MKSYRLCTALMTTLAFFIAACTADKLSVPTPAPPPAPIADTAPYLCRLVPEQAFRLITGTTGALLEGSMGNKESGKCWAPDKNPHPLEVGWLQVGDGTTQEHLDFLMHDRHQLYSRYDGVKLPTDLGEGMAARLTNTVLADQPYRVSAKFRCGGKDRMVDIFLARVVAGRDAIKDLTALMRIAQKRYAEVHRCGTQAL